MPIDIIPYREDFAQAFYTLNMEWLQSYFKVEAFDQKVLSNPKKYIINKGGHIFFAKSNNDIIGTIALLPTKENSVLELTKMAVSPKHRGLKIGQQLLSYTIDFAKSNHHKSLMLYSSTKLENAIYIYRKYGFVEIPVEENSPYKRSDIKMELLL